MPASNLAIIIVLALLLPAFALVVVVYVKRRQGGPVKGSAWVSVFFALFFAPRAAEARLTRLEILDVESPTFEGRVFGTTGRYERVAGIAHGELDPNSPLNTVVVNLQRAPRNAAGRVEYAIDFYILKPVDVSLGNGGILFETLGGGTKGVIALFNSGSTDSNPHLAADAGTGHLMNEGYTIVWSAWEGGVSSDYGQMVARLPVATSTSGGPIVRRIRQELINESGESPFVGDLLYATSSLNPSLAVLTVRQNERDMRITPSDLRWRYLSDRQIEITRPAGYDAGALYELVYSARDPIVMGIGIASVRDVVSFLRYGTADDLAVPNPLAPSGRPAIRFAQAIGFSQPGKLLRDFIYYGFNEDEAHRMVFDGVQPALAGARRTFTNYEFALPDVGQSQHAEHGFPGGDFPFTYRTLTDPLSGRTDGILLRCQASRTCPKIMQTDSDTELWQSHASLLVTDTAGNDIVQPENVRVYLFAGTQHGPDANPSRGICQQYDNPVDWSYHVRALTKAMHEWIVRGTPPPDSRYPSRSSGTLVRADPASIGWPDIPYIEYNGLMNEIRLMDYSVVPPDEGAAYPLFVGRVDADGNTIGGIRHPYLLAPDATYTGWNLRDLGHAPHEMCDLNGTSVPFYGTRADRLVAGDPRLSYEERYADHQGYVDAVAAAVDRLIAERLLLPEDRDALIFVADQKFVLCVGC